MLETGERAPLEAVVWTTPRERASIGDLLHDRPLLLLGSGIEPNLEAAFLFPLAQVLHVRVGGRVYTFQGDLLWGLSAGLSLTL